MCLRAFARCGLTGAFALAACTGDAAASARPPPPPVQRCVNIANALNAPNEGDWGFTIEARYFPIIAKAGFDSVRLPIAWQQHADEAAPYRIDPAFFARVDEVVAQARLAGLKVILDLHDYDALSDAPAAHWDRFVALWDQIALHYRDAPREAVIFELLNEPRAKLEGAALDALMKDALAAVRATNPDRTVIVGGGNWNSVSGLLASAPPKDAQLTATFHYYHPHAFSHQGADFGTDAPPLGRHWGSAAERAELERHFDRAAAWAAERSLPLLLGEFGVFRAAPADQRALYMKAAREAAEARGIGWCAFDFAASFILYDLEAERWIPELQDALGLPADE